MIYLHVRIYLIYVSEGENIKCLNKVAAVVIKVVLVDVTFEYHYEMHFKTSQDFFHHGVSGRLQRIKLFCSTMYKYEKISLAIAPVKISQAVRHGVTPKRA